MGVLYRERKKDKLMAGGLVNKCRERYIAGDVKGNCILFGIVRKEVSKLALFVWIHINALR